MNAEQTLGNEASSHAFGLSPNRLRGLAALALLVAAFYAFVFESEPPPKFSDIEVVIPPPPATDFEEREIVLPEFEAVAEEPVEEPPANVTVAPAQPVEQPAPQPAAPQPGQDGQASAGLPVPPAAEQRQAGRRGFFVQVAALKDAAVAAQLAADLRALLDEPVYVEVSDRDGVIYNRVRIGPYGDRQGKANEVKSRLAGKDAELGNSAFVDEY